MQTDPERPPHSVDWFAMVSLASMGNDRIVSSLPVNSIAWFRTSSFLKRPQSATITSLPVVPSGKVPVNVTLAIGGICHLDGCQHSRLESALPILRTMSCQLPKYSPHPCERWAYLKRRQSPVPKVVTRAMSRC